MRTKNHDTFIEDFIRDFSNEVNSTCHDPEEYAQRLFDAIRWEHRTLQASMMRVIFVFLAKYADTGYDLRNEAAVEVCKKIKELPIHIPLI